jgi:7tm Chemosensory receptor
MNYEKFSTFHSSLSFAEVEMENVFTAFEPFLGFSKLVGFCNVSYDGPTRKGIFKVKWINIFASSFLIAFFTVFNFFNAKNGNFVDIDSDLLYYGWMIPSLFEMGSQLILLLWQFSKRKHFVSVLRKLQDVDEKVKFNFMSLKSDLIDHDT